MKNETDKIDVKDFAAGVYYVRTYNDENFIKSMKFIKK
ncbi:MULTISPECIES: T9SS type A sorting domain-containing protein [unclassified Chryseobacterium]